MRTFFAVLSERDRRLYAAVEASKLGHGGICYIASVLGCCERTIFLTPYLRCVTPTTKLAGTRMSPPRTTQMITDRFLISAPFKTWLTANPSRPARREAVKSRL